MKPFVQPEDYVPALPCDFIGGAHAVAKILQGKAKRLRQSESAVAKILLYGAPGVGKTRLAEYFARQLTTHDIQIERTNGRNVNVDLVRQWQQAERYISVCGVWSVKIVDELDTCPAAAQDLLLTYLDHMPRCTAFIGTSNLNIECLVERFQTRLQQFHVEPPDAQSLNRFLSTWKLGEKIVGDIIAGCGGNVRAALLDAQSILDAQSA
jgi:replication-associated recombination protein RarA